MGTMAATTLEEAPDFDTWLSFKLKSLDTDDDVFGSYIKGILEGEESQDEKIEAIEGILGEIASSDSETQKDVCKEILDKWESFLSAGSKAESVDTSISVDAQIAKIMEQQALCVVPTRKTSEESKKLKQSILTLYATVSDEEDDDNDYEAYDSGDDRGLMKNTNAEEVRKVEQMKKDVLRAESHKKKEKDREDREKQKQSQVDRKEKEKKRTMKGEKRR